MTNSQLDCLNCGVISDTLIGIDEFCIDCHEQEQAFQQDMRRAKREWDNLSQFEKEQFKEKRRLENL